MHAQLEILFQSIVPATRFPHVCVKHQTQRLSEIVQLQSSRSQGCHDGGIVNDLSFNPLGLSTDQEISVSSGCCGIPYDEKRDVDLVCILENVVGFQLYCFTGSEDDRSSIKLFLSVIQEQRGNPGGKNLQSNWYNDIDLQVFLLESSRYWCMLPDTLSRSFLRPGDDCVDKRFWFNSVPDILLLVSLSHLQSLDSNVFFITQSKSNHMKHFERFAVWSGPIDAASIQL